MGQPKAVDGVKDFANGVEKGRKTAGLAELAGLAKLGVG